MDIDIANNDIVVKLLESCSCLMLVDNENYHMAMNCQRTSYYGYKTRFGSLSYIKNFLNDHPNTFPDEVQKELVVILNLMATVYFNYFWHENHIVELRRDVATTILKIVNCIKDINNIDYDGLCSIENRLNNCMVVFDDNTTINNIFKGILIYVDELVKSDNSTDVILRLECLKCALRMLQTLVDIQTQNLWLETPQTESDYDITKNLFKSIGTNVRLIALNVRQLMKHNDNNALIEQSIKSTVDVIDKLFNSIKKFSCVHYLDLTEANQAMSDIEMHTRCKESDNQ